MLKTLQRNVLSSLPPSFFHSVYPRTEAIRALGRIGPGAKDAVPTLTGIATRDTKDLPPIELFEVDAARDALEKIQR